jgi:hypothetical protein
MYSINLNQKTPLLHPWSQLLVSLRDLNHALTYWANIAHLSVASVNSHIEIRIERCWRAILTLFFFFCLSLECVEVGRSPCYIFIIAEPMFLNILLHFLCSFKDPEFPVAVFKLTGRFKPRNGNSTSKRHVLCLSFNQVCTARYVAHMQWLNLCPKLKPKLYFAPFYRFCYRSW